EPTMIGHDGAREIAMWDLKGLTLQIGSGTAEPVWRNLNAGFALGLYHQGATTKSEGELQAAVGALGATVKLTSGGLQFEHTPVVPVRVSKMMGNVRTHVVSSHFPSAIAWSGETKSEIPVSKAGASIKPIILKPGAATLSVTNVARIQAPAGLAHFSEYYALVNLAPDDSPLTLEHSEADIPVYDCVPPAATPLPLP